jgi:hypothetical protein
MASGRPAAALTARDVTVRPRGWAGTALHRLGRPARAGRSGQSARRRTARVVPRIADADPRCGAGTCRRAWYRRRSWRRRRVAARRGWCAGTAPRLGGERPAQLGPLRRRQPVGAGDHLSRWGHELFAGGGIAVGNVGVVADHEPLMLGDLDFLDSQVGGDLLVAALPRQPPRGLGRAERSLSPRMAGGPPPGGRVVFRHRSDRSLPDPRTLASVSDT